MTSIHRKRLRFSLLFVAYSMIAHFGYGFFLMSGLMIGNDFFWAYLRFLIPYCCITAIFVLGAVFTHTNHLAISVSMVALAILLSISLCIYDFTNYRCQVDGTGHGPIYHMWWWYYEPYWHGYRPGNV